MTTAFLFERWMSLLAVGCAVVGVARAEEAAYAVDATGFAQVVQPFLQAHCVKCHGPEKQKAKLRLDTLQNQFTHPAVAAKWAEVVTSINAHQMPPEEEEPPELAESGRFVDWLTTELGRAEIARRSTRVVLRRLNRSEYNNTLRDLVGVDSSPADSFPEDPPAGGLRQHRSGAVDLAPATRALLLGRTPDPRPGAGGGRATGVDQMAF